MLPRVAASRQRCRAWGRGSQARQVMVHGRVEVDGVRNADGGEGGVRASLEGSGSQETKGKRICHATAHLLVVQIVVCSLHPRASPNARAERDDKGLTEVYMDCCFCGGQNEEVLRVFCLVIREWVVSFLVQGAGRERPARDSQRKRFGNIRKQGHRQDRSKVSQFWQ